MYTFYGNYYVYLCVYIIMGDYLYAYIVIGDYLCVYIVMYNYLSVHIVMCNYLYVYKKIYMYLYDNGLWKVSPNIQYLLELFVISSNNQIMYKLLFILFIIYMYIY